MFLQVGAWLLRFRCGPIAGNRLLTFPSVLPVAADVLCEFLEVAFHLILYVREVYPAVVFERRNKYNVPVQVRQPTAVFGMGELNSLRQDKHAR